MSQYVELDKQSSFTGDTDAIKFLPKGLQAAAAAEVVDTALPYKEVVHPSPMGPGSAAQRADLRARAAAAGVETKTGLMAKLKKAFTKGIQDQGDTKKEFDGYGDAKDDLLSVGLTALQAGAGAAAKQIAAPSVAAAEEAKRKEEAAARNAKIKMVVGGLALLGLAYFFFKGR